MKVVILRTGTSDFGKVGTYNVQEVGLAKALIKNGFGVDVLFLNRNVQTIEDDETYKYVHYLPHRHIGLHGIFNVNLLEQYQPSCLILFSDNQLWAKNVINWCKNRSIPIIHYYGNVLSDNPRILHQLYTKLILMRNINSYKYSINIAKTNKVKCELEKNHIHCDGVINVGLDTDIMYDKRNIDLQIRESLGFKANDVVLLFVGRLVEYKKPLMACDIVSSMRNQGINAKLLIIGKGAMEEQLVNYIAETASSEYIEYIGRVKYDEMYKYFVSCDCFINLSDQEIFGMTILEAMYYQCPVVARSAPGPNDIIVSGKTGYLIDNDDLQVWVQTIEKALIERIPLGEAARKDITERFVWDMVCDKFTKAMGIES